MKILFLLPYAMRVAPSQRFRVEQYLGILTDVKHTYEVQTFFSSHSRARSGPGKLWPVFTGFVRRFLIIFRLHRFDFVFIHREAAPVGPPLIEWMLAKVFRKKVIYDYDDAIWSTDNPAESRLEKTLRWRSKVRSICSWSTKVSCGNRYLSDFARRVNNNVVINPTTIDTIGMHNRNLFAPVAKKSGITIGWTGSSSTVKYLEALEPVFQSLEKKYQGLSLLVIADRCPSMKLASMVFRPWSIASEVQDLLTVDIGVMPLPDDEWAKGKCGFKALQYLALEIPAVISPVGVNTEIILEGANGFLATTQQEWITKLEHLIADAGLRARLGKAGRVTVEENYSVISNAANFLSLFE